MITKNLNNKQRISISMAGGAMIALGIKYMNKKPDEAVIRILAGLAMVVIGVSGDMPMYTKNIVDAAAEPKEVVETIKENLTPREEKNTIN